MNSGSPCHEGSGWCSWVSATSAGNLTSSRPCARAMLPWRSWLTRKNTALSRIHSSDFPKSLTAFLYTCQAQVSQQPWCAWLAKVDVVREGTVPCPARCETARNWYGDCRRAAAASCRSSPLEPSCPPRSQCSCRCTLSTQSAHTAVEWGTSRSRT